MGNSSTSLKMNTPLQHFDMVDTNHDDKITLAELTSFAASRDIVVADNHLAEYFRAMDRNKKGYLTALEFDTLVTILQQELEDSSTSVLNQSPSSRVQHVLIEGILLKQENVRVTTRDRWSKKYVRCIEVHDGAVATDDVTESGQLRSNCFLEYYANTTTPMGQEKPRKSLEVSKCRLNLSVADGKRKQHDHTFSVVYETGYEMIFRCSSSTEWSEWTSSLIPLMAVVHQNDIDGYQESATFSNGTGEFVINASEPLTIPEDQISLRARSSRGVDGTQPNASWSESESSDEAAFPEEVVDDGIDGDLDEGDDRRADLIGLLSAGGVAPILSNSVTTRALSPSYGDSKETQLGTERQENRSSPWMSVWEKLFMSGDEEQKGYLNKEEATQVLREAFGADTKSYLQPETAQASAKEVVRRMLVGKEDRISFEVFVGLMQEMKKGSRTVPISPPSAKMNNRQSPLLEMKETPHLSAIRTRSPYPGRSRSTSPARSSPRSSSGFLSSPSFEQNERTVDLDRQQQPGFVRFQSVESDDSEMPDGEGVYRRQRLRRRRKAESSRHAAQNLLDRGSEALRSAHEHSIISLKKSALQVKALDNDPRSLKLLQKQCDEMTRKLSLREVAYKKQLVEEVNAYKKQLKDLTRTNIDLANDYEKMKADYEKMKAENDVQREELAVQQERLTTTTHDNLGLQAEVERLQFILRHFGVEDSKSDNNALYITLSSFVSMLSDNKISFREESETITGPASQSDAETVRNFISYLPPNLRLVFSANRPQQQREQEWKRFKDEVTGKFYYFNSRTGVSKWHSPEMYGDKAKVLQQSSQYGPSNGPTTRPSASRKAQATRASLTTDKTRRYRKEYSLTSGNPPITSNEKMKIVGTISRATSLIRATPTFGKKRNGTNGT